MNKDQIIGTAKKIEGNAKDMLGDVLGDAKLQAEGKIESVKGSVQNMTGNVKDSARAIYDDAPESLKINIKKTVDLIRANPAIASLAVATVGGLATWYAASVRKH